MTVYFSFVAMMADAQLLQSVIGLEEEALSEKVDTGIWMKLPDSSSQTGGRVKASRNAGT